MPGSRLPGAILSARIPNFKAIAGDARPSWSAFGGDIDYAQLVKIYGKPIDGDTRYSPAELIRPH